MTRLQLRLEAVQRHGNLRVADLARWFDVPYSTVRCWTQGVEPNGGPQDNQRVEYLLARLEKLVHARKDLPLPRLSPQARIKRLRALRGRT